MITEILIGSNSSTKLSERNFFYLEGWYIVSSVSCFIHTLQLIIKDSLFSKNNVSVFIAKARPAVIHFHHPSTAGFPFFFQITTFKEIEKAIAPSNKTTKKNNNLLHLTPFFCIYLQLKNI